MFLTKILKTSVKPILFKDLADQILGNKKTGAVGIEPTSTVLETAVLPLNYAPIYPVFQPPNAIITYRRFPCQD